VLRELSAVALLLPGACLGFLGPSSTGFTFMKIGVGARAVAMGGAFTAVADDANALFWNPAGLALDNGFHADLTMMKLLQSVSYTSAGLVTPLGSRVGFGAAGGYLSASDTRRDERGQELGTFGLSDFAAGAGIGWQPVRNLGVGLGGRYVAGTIDSFRAYALSLDGGIIYRPLSYFTVGASLLHMGPPRKFIADWEYPPVNLRSGVALRIPFAENHVLVASDLSFYPDFAPTLSLGGELYLRLRGSPSAQGGQTEQGFAVRAGYQSGLHLGSWSGFSVGIGYDYAIASGLSLGLDVVYLSYGLLGDSERASISLKFVPRGRNHR
jgi:hypothetical protein